MYFRHSYPKKVDASAWLLILPTLVHRILTIYTMNNFCNINNLSISNVVFVCSACSTTLPDLPNGIVVSGNTGGPYFDGHVINYMCSTDFATTNAPISCTCDVTTDPNNPAWSCSPMFTTPICRRS